MPPLEDHLYVAARDALDTIPAEHRPDVYVVSFFTYDEHDDPRFPTVSVGYSTETHVAETGDLFDEEEARWNLMMPPYQLRVVFERTADAEGAAIREAWARENGTWYDLEDGEDPTFNPRGEPLTHAFVAAEIAVVQRLHAEGDIVRVFGRPLPVLIHELEYYEAIGEQNLAANPPGLVDDFARYCGVEPER